MQSKEYLLSISKKVQHYYNVRSRTIKYIQKESISNKDLQVSLLVIAAIWAADRLNEELTEDMLLSVFGLESNNQSHDNKFFSLAPEHQHLSLNEILDVTVESF